MKDRKKLIPIAAIVVMGIMGICFFKSIFVKAASFPELSVDYSGIINVME